MEENQEGLELTVTHQPFCADLIC